MPALGQRLTLMFSATFPKQIQVYSFLPLCLQYQKNDYSSGVGT
jgi:hypothetical protein